MAPLAPFARGARRALHATTRGWQPWHAFWPVHRVLRALPELVPPPELPDRLARIDESETTIDNALYDDDAWAASWHREDNEHLASLQLLNPARVPYFHAAWRDQLRCEPSSGARRFLDIGCGGGIVTEELAGLGYPMHGIDLSEKAIAYARERAASRKASNLRYDTGSAYDLSAFEAGSFDGVLMSDILEHLHDLPTAVSEVARVLKPGGVLIFDTINRTVLSYVLTIVLAQDVLRIVPPGTHDWRLYIRPEELSLLLQRHGFEVDSAHFVGMTPTIDVARLLGGRVPLGDFQQSHHRMRANYLGWARLRHG